MSSSEDLLAMTSHYSGDYMLDDHHESVNPKIPLILAALGVVVALLCCGSCMACCAGALMPCVPSPSHIQKQNDRRRASGQEESNDPWFDLCAGPWCLGVLFLISTCFALTYTLGLQQRNAQEFHGPMRIVKVDFVTSEDYTASSCSGCHDIKIYHQEVQVTLDWGYKWACGAVAAKSCQSSIFLPDCQVEICRKCPNGNGPCWDKCDMDKATAALAQAHNCSLNYWDFANFSTYVPYTALEDDPSDDVDWPHVAAFGDCDTCEATFYIDSPETLYRNRVTTLVLLGACGVVAALLCMRNQCYGLLEEEEEKNEEEKGEEAEEVEAQKVEADGNLKEPPTPSSKTTMTTGSGKQYATKRCKTLHYFRLFKTNLQKALAEWYAIEFSGGSLSTSDDAEAKDAGAANELGDNPGSSEDGPLFNRRNRHL